MVVEVEASSARRNELQTHSTRVPDLAGLGATGFVAELDALDCVRAFPSRLHDVLLSAVRVRYTPSGARIPSIKLFLLPLDPWGLNGVVRGGSGSSQAKTSPGASGSSRRSVGATGFAALTSRSQEASVSNAVTSKSSC